MAKRAELPADETQSFFEDEPQKTGKRSPSKDPIITKGLSLKTSEWNLLESIGDELGTNRHAVAVWAIRDFLKRYSAGEIETVEKRTLPGM